MMCASSSRGIWRSPCATVLGSWMISVGIDQRLVRAAVLLLQPLGVRLRDAESVHDVARDVVAAERDRAEMADLPLVEDGEVGGAGAHLDERDAELLLVLGEHGERARQRLEHELPHLVAGALDALAQVDRRRASRS